MKIETPYGNVEPQTVWGSCPGLTCEGELTWHEEGPICPECGHLWDHNGGDIGSWDENMGEPWEGSTTYQNFRNQEDESRAWWDAIRAKAGTRS
jgi:hypothetical protein